MVNSENEEDNFREDEELDGSMQSVGIKIDLLTRGRYTGDYAQRIGHMLDEISFILIQHLNQLEEEEKNAVSKSTLILPIHLS